MWLGWCFVVIQSDGVGAGFASGWRFITDFNERAFKLTLIQVVCHRYLMSRVVRVSIASWVVFRIAYSIRREDWGSSGVSSLFSAGRALWGLISRV